MTFGSVFNLSSLNGSNGFALNGIKASDYSGSDISYAGDINGDGNDDLIIGAYGADPNGSSSGQSYVVFGSTNPFAASFNLSNLNGSNGFALDGLHAFDNLGLSVSAAGDINGDGQDDLIVGASGASPNGDRSGQSYVVFGSTNPFAASFNLSSLNGSNGFALNGIEKSDNSGYSVSSAGDINGDGKDDLIIGAIFAHPNGNYSGQSYVVFGSSNSFAASFNLSSLNGSNGFALNGIDAYDFSGISVSSAGDINGDGKDDLIIGARGANFDPDSRSGQSYVVFGSTKPFTASFNLSNLNGSNGFALNGINNSDYSGHSVSSAGDINGDGKDDLIIGAWGASPNGVLSGQSYVVFGSTKPFTANFNLSNLNGSNGFIINGIKPMDFSGWSVSGAGDINGDGNDDLILGAFSADPNGSNSGQSYVIFGSTGGFASSLNLSSLNGGNGFAINGIKADDELGISVSNAGDINNDGQDDLIIGAKNGSVNGNRSGQSYVIFGQTYSIIKGDGNNNLLNGTNEDDTISGFGGDDTLNGLKGNDSLMGGTGNDRLFAGAGNDTLQGGTGNDTLQGGTGNDIYTINTLADVVQETSTIISEIDTVETSISHTLGNNLENLTLIGTGNINGVGNNRQNVIIGNDGNNSLKGGAGNDTLNGGLGNDSFYFSTGVVFDIDNLGVDTIGGFTKNNDRIILSKTTFTAISSNVGTGFSDNSDFATVTTFTEAQISAAKIVYNSHSGRLFYNQNGTEAGFGDWGAFAVFLGNPNLDASSFSIIA